MQNKASKNISGIVLSVALLSPLLFVAQNTTISQKNKNEREAKSAHKVLLIPFEPKLYMGEIDQAINAETKLSARQIKNKFRDGLNEQLYKAFKAIPYNVLDLMDDTLKYQKDLDGIYQYLSYQYQKVPSQENYKAPQKEKEEKKIDKGQLVVETNGDKRFMNAKLSNPKVIPQLTTKFKTDIFVFVNQLDIKASGGANFNNINNLDSPRKIVVHYTVFNHNSQEINSGTAEEEFEIDLNNPKKIIDKHFSKLAATIAFRVNKAMFVPAE